MFKRFIFMGVSDRDSPCIPKLEKHTCNFHENTTRVKSQVEKAGGNSLYFTPTNLK